VSSDSGPGGVQELLQALLERVKQAIEADTAAVLLVDRSARQLIV